MRKNTREASLQEPERPASTEAAEVASSRPTGLTRRSFIARLNATGVAAAARIPLLKDISAAQVETSPAPPGATGEAPRGAMVLNINGRDYNSSLSRE